MGPNDVPCNQVQYVLKIEFRANFLVILWKVEVVEWLRQDLVLVLAGGLALLLQISIVYRKKIKKIINVVEKIYGRW